VLPCAATCDWPRPGLTARCSTGRCSLTPERWAEIEKLFHRVADCEAEQRNSLLDEACDSDSELRQQVEVLLASEESAGNRMQAAVHGGLDAMTFPLVGKTVSHYHILDGLGGGGMGLVYRAEDIKLGRQVALKFLPEESAKDPAALGRFEREARSASALEHPNICPIYEFGEHEGQPFLVMQLLQGQTLRDLLSAKDHPKPSLETSKVLDLALQIAEGLQAAHRHGIIHRDIKPANIFITDQGQAKILDFGLAKLASRGLSDEEPDHATRDLTDGEQTTHDSSGLATPDPLLTRTGVAMGTAGYMSPEQARGEKLDVRTDVFSFGLVLYEMATGRRAFQGSIGPVLHDAILKLDPASPRKLNPSLPEELGKIIQKALQKKRDERYPSAAELAVDLRNLKQRLQPKSRANRWLGAAAVLIVACAGTIYWLARRQPSAPLQSKLRQITFNSIENRVSNGAISPNGKLLAYSDSKGVRVKTIETGETRTIPPPDELKGKNLIWENPPLPWFPDNNSLLITAHLPDSLADLSSVGSSMWIAHVRGEAPRKLRDEALVWSVSPDGNWIGFLTHRSHRGDQEIWLVRPNGEDAHLFVDSGGESGLAGPMWTADSKRLMYDKALWNSAGDKSDTVVIADASSKAMIGELPNQMVQPWRLFNWLPDGRMIASINDNSGPSSSCNLWLMRLDERRGRDLEAPRQLTSLSGSCADNPTVSQDGKRIAFLQTRGHSTVYVGDLDAGGTRIVRERHFTLSETDDHVAGWTPDSKAVIFGRTGGDSEGLYRQSIDSDTPELLASSRYIAVQVSPDGRWLVSAKWTNVDVRDRTLDLTRTPMAGGPPELIFRVVAHPWFRISCSTLPANLCVTEEPSADRKQLVITSFDPVRGRGSELRRFDLDPNVIEWNCELSPDGTRVAVFAAPGSPIHILSLRDKSEQVIRLPGFTNLRTVGWTAKSKALLAVNGAQLYYVDLQGRAKLLKQRTMLDPHDYLLVAVSPDGRHIAFDESALNANMWMLENF
jgi:eukaryotic-like serine/threonine-protein kinase